VSGDSLVRIERLTRRYGELVAVEDLSLEVYQGEMLGLIGPDGAGKTTTIRVLLGLLAPNRGRVETCGLDPLARRYELSQKVGYLSQRFSLYGDLTVDENIAFFAEIHGLRKWKPRREELLEMVRMTPFRSRLAERLSGGMKQKLALACTLIHTPELLVLDEPTTGVDPVSRRDFWKLLAHLQRDGLTILLTTPYLDEAERCERVAFLDHGRLLVVDTPDALRGSITGAFLEVVARPRQQVVEYLRSRDGVSGLEIFGDRIHVTLTEVDPALAAAQARELKAELLGAGLTVDLIRASEPTLEDTFIHWIRAENAKRQVALSQSPA
jgi:ABC-2 type transport system ATP-binding protein